jgi:nucleoside phosphorylase
MQPAQSTLIFYAFAREIGPFKRRSKNRKALQHQGLSGFDATIAGKQFTVVGHGIGHRRAGEIVRRTLDTIERPELIIGTGVAGALSSGLTPGDLILADKILLIRGEGANAEVISVPAENDLREIGRSLAVAGLKYSRGALLTSYRALINGVEKRTAKTNTGAIAVDMETAAIASEAVARGMPFIALRAVLDEVDDEIVGAEMANADGSVRPLAATGYLVRNPGVVLKLPRMIRNLARATAAIADALEAIAYEGEVP